MDRHPKFTSPGRAGDLTFVGTVGQYKTCCSTENALSIYHISGGKSALNFQNHLNVPDRPTSTHDVTRNCFRFIKIKFVWIGFVIYILKRFVDYLVLVTLVESIQMYRCMSELLDAQKTAY